MISHYKTAFKIQTQPVVDSYSFLIAHIAFLIVTLNYDSKLLETQT